MWESRLLTPAAWALIDNASGIVLDATRADTRRMHKEIPV